MHTTIQIDIVALNATVDINLYIFSDGSYDILGGETGDEYGCPVMVSRDLINSSMSASEVLELESAIDNIEWEGE